MTATGRFVVRREHTVPAHKRLREAAMKAEAAGQSWELLVAVPPPSLGLSRQLTVETLIVGAKATQCCGSTLRRGSWDAGTQTVHVADGRVFDASGKPTVPPRARQRR